MCAESGLFFTTMLFSVVRAEVFHGIPEKNAEMPAQVGISNYKVFVQAIFHFSTSLHRPLVPHTIGELYPCCFLEKQHNHLHPCG